MVESALILLVFIVLMVGIFDFAQFLFVHQALVERVRHAARWGALSYPPDLAGTVNMVLYDRSTTPDGASGYFGLTADMVRVTTDGAGTDDYRLTVRVSNYPFMVLSPLAQGQHRGQPITVSVPIGYIE